MDVDCRIVKFLSHFLSFLWLGAGGWQLFTLTSTYL